MNLDIPQAGKIIFEGELATRFWVRTLNLQSEVDGVQALLRADNRRKRAAVPIVAEYQVDPRLRFVYLIIANIDELGIQNGTGVIYYASPDNYAKALALRDAMADEAMKDLEKRGFDEVVEIEEKTETKRQD